MHKKQAAIFDLDGTLAPTMDVLKNYFIQRVQELLNRSISQQEFMQFYHHDMSMYLSQLGLTDQAQVQQLDLELRALEKKQSRSEFFQGTVELIRDLHQANYHLYLWTLRYHQSALQMLQHNKVAHFFIDMHCGDHHEPKPSHVGIQEKLLENYHEMFMIGDTVTDIVGGKNLGAKTIGVTWAKTHTKEMFDNIGADFIFEDVLMLRNHLLQKY